MYECPNCAGNLKFDIASRQLLCEHCNTLMDPYSFYKEKDAEETKEYDVTVFTCPQCGGQILSEDTTAATFCSFCGSATILDSRISRERRPDYIIPFSKTQEDCKNAYAKMMRRAVFAPKELKDKAHIEKFRGIYMPYWIYSFETKGGVQFEGKRSHRRGDYRIVKYYNLTSEVDASYEGITYDASASFSDNLSSAIGPYDLEGEKPFAPTFLSGFYADTSDVDGGVYQSEAQDMAVTDGAGRMGRSHACSRYHVDRYKLKNALWPHKATIKQAMLPVWFLSYKNNDRVAYAVINGQTGKAAADLPVDPKKYMIGSLLLAVPLFLLLNAFFTFKPVITLLFSAFLALVCAGLSSMQMSRILKKESGADDRGLLFKQNAARRHEAWEYPEARKKRVSFIGGRMLEIMMKVMITMIIGTVIPIMLMKEFLRGGSGIMTGTFVIVVIIVAVMLPTFKKAGRNLKEILSVLAKPFGAIALALVIFFANPVSDFYYYIGAIVSMAMIIWNFMDIIKRFNLLATRKLPQFNRRGGDNIG